METTYSRARAHFASLLDQVIRDRETVLIRRRNKETVALISESELSGLLETAHLLRSPRNAERLLSALLRARKQRLKPMTLEKLRSEVGLGGK